MNEGAGAAPGARKAVLIAIHSRHVDARNVPPEAAHVRGWRQRRILYCCAPGNNDDWYRLYAAVAPARCASPRARGGGRQGGGARGRKSAPRAARARAIGAHRGRLAPPPPSPPARAARVERRDARPPLPLDEHAPALEGAPPRALRDRRRAYAAAEAAARPPSPRSRPQPGAREVRVYAPPPFSVRTQHVGMPAPPLEGGAGLPEQFWFFPEGAPLVDHTRQRGTQGASTTKVERTRADSEWLCFLPTP